MRERFGAVARGAVECGLVGADHRQHRVALRGDAAARQIDRVGGAVKQRVDRSRHAVGDRFEMRACGLAGRLHPDDMRGEALRGAAGHRVGLAAAFGERDDLRVECGGVFAGRQTRAFETLGDVVDIRLCTGKGGDQDAEAGLCAGSRGCEVARVGCSLVDFGDHAATDRGELFGRAAAHRHERVQLFGKVLAIGVDRVRQRCDGALQAGRFVTHRLRRDAEPMRLGAAGAHGEQPDDADERRDDTERCDELDQRDRFDRSKRAACDPQHRGQPDNDDRNGNACKHRAAFGRRLLIGLVEMGLGDGFGHVFYHRIHHDVRANGMGIACRRAKPDH
ncbi:hypothetical protein [Sphingomonas sp. LR55]|uniref:hypothetical protein n=1 Tax=Sphingomonas sp. LR55 TaxID=3050231 RepID=UPI002FE11164